MSMGWAWISRVSGIQLQFRDGLQGGNLRACATREHPGLRWGAVREEGKASKTNRRPPLGGICEDENRWGEYLLLREKHPNTQLVCGERLQARQTVEGGRFSRLGKRSLWTTGCERRNEPLEAVQQRYLGPHRAGEENLTDYAEERPHGCCGFAEMPAHVIDDKKERVELVLRYSNCDICLLVYCGGGGVETKDVGGNTQRPHEIIGRDCRSQLPPLLGS